MATDLTRMTPAALAFYFDEVDFRDLPNAIPMSWTANGVDSTGQVSGMVTLNRGHTPPGGNV